MEVVGLRASSNMETDVLVEENVLSSNKEIVYARNATDTRAQHFVVNDDCYYPSWKHSRSALHHWILLEMLDVFSFCILVEESVALTSSNALVARTAPDTPNVSRGSSRGVWTAQNKDFLVLVICIWVYQSPSAQQYNIKYKYFLVSAQRATGTWR
jgi:hypothetical protein